MSLFVASVAEVAYADAYADADENNGVRKTKQGTPSISIERVKFQAVLFARRFPMRSYARRRDANQGEIESAYRQLLGDHVTDSSAWAGGAGDLFISFGGEHTQSFCQFVEIKISDKAEYTAAQIRFRNRHPGCVKRIETVDQAIEHAQWIRQQVKRLSEAT